jgi:predicted DNA-binding protein
MNMAAKKIHGKTRSGVPITEELIEKLSKEAEDGFDVDEMLGRRRGRPPIGSGPATVESVRLDPELRQALAARAANDEEPTSTVIREALRQYLGAG